MEVVDHLIDHGAGRGGAILANAPGLARDPGHEFGPTAKEFYVANELLHRWPDPPEPRGSQKGPLYRLWLQSFDRNYHKRSNVESVFSALKRKFVESIRSRKPVAQVNEVLCKLIAYNLMVVVHEMFENGIAPSFEHSTGQSSGTDAV